MEPFSNIPIPSAAGRTWRTHQQAATTDSRTGSITGRTPHPLCGAKTRTTTGRPLRHCTRLCCQAVYNLPTTEILLDQLKSDIRLRRLCGWERQQEIPSRATFSRAFTEFAETQLAERVHSALIETHLGDQLIGHISRDSTAILAREKPEKKVVEIKSPKKRGRPKKGEERIKEPTRLERQSAGMTLAEMKLTCQLSVMWVRNATARDTKQAGMATSFILMPLMAASR